MEIWLVWLREDEWGDTNLMDPAHASQASALAWCNENRKLEGGDPIQWKVSRDVEPVDYGESANCRRDLGKHGEHRFTAFYSLQVMKVE